MAKRDMTEDVKTEIRKRIENRAAAVTAGDRKGNLARQSADLLMFKFPDTK